MLTATLKSFDTLVIIATTNSSITLSFKGISLMLIPISTGRACGLTISKKVIYEIVVKKDNKYKKQNQRNQQTLESFDKLYRKSLQDDLFVLFCTRYVDEAKKNFFL